MFNENLSPNAVLCEKAVYSRTVLAGMSGQFPPHGSPSGAFVDSDRCGCSAVPTAGMLAKFICGPANGSGNRVGWPPNPGPKGRNVMPLKLKSSRPSSRGSNFAQADPYWPGKLIGARGRFGFTLTTANNAEFMKPTL